MNHRIRNNTACGLASVAALLLLPMTGQAIGEGAKASEVVGQILESESISATQSMAEMLSEYSVDDANVKKLIDGASSSMSDSRRNVLWHAIRYTRSRLGRDYLIEAIPAAALPLRIEWIQSLLNPASFDIPILVAVYESAENESSTDEKSLKEFFVGVAMGRWRDTRTTTWHSRDNPELYHGVGNRRQADADAAQMRILLYLMTNGHDIDTRIAAYEYKGHPWFKGMESESRLRMAEQIMATGKTAAERAKLVSALRQQLHPTQFLYGSEAPEVKLAAISAIGQLVEDNWRGTGGYDVLREAYRSLMPIARDEDYPEISRAANRMIRAMEIRYGEKAKQN